jgi:2-hydroxyisobutanoyl-CoA mutase large subunit
VIDEVDRGGGTVRLTQEGWFQRRIADFAYETALKKASGEKPVIGVNRFVDPEETFAIELHPYDASTAQRQVARLQRVRRERDNAKVSALLERLVDVAQREDDNIMPVTIELVAAGATMGDIVEKLKTLWGTYRENPVF